MYLADSGPFREGERHHVRACAHVLVVGAGVGLHYGGKHRESVCDALASGLEARASFWWGTVCSILRGLASPGPTCLPLLNVDRAQLGCTGLRSRED